MNKVENGTQVGKVREMLIDKRQLTQDQIVLGLEFLHILVSAADELAEILGKDTAEAKTAKEYLIGLTRPPSLTEKQAADKRKSEREA